MSYSSFGRLAMLFQKVSYWQLARRKNPGWSSITSTMAELCQKFVLSALYDGLLVASRMTS